MSIEKQSSDKGIELWNKRRIKVFLPAILASKTITGSKEVYKKKQKEFETARRLPESLSGYTFLVDDIVSQEKMKYGGCDIAFVTLLRSPGLLPHLITKVFEKNDPLTKTEFQALLQKLTDNPELVSSTKYTARIVEKTDMLTQLFELSGDSKDALVEAISSARTYGKRKKSNCWISSRLPKEIGRYGFLLNRVKLNKTIVLGGEEKSIANLLKTKGYTQAALAEVLKNEKRLTEAEFTQIAQDVYRSRTEQNRKVRKDSSYCTKV